jgi:hypothetical protein
MGYNNVVGPGSADVLRQIHNTYPQQPVDSRYVQLFDPEHPQRPHPTLMPHFIQIFFDRYASEFTFLTYEETLTKSWEQRLSPLLSNCIAAMAARHVPIHTPPLLVVSDRCIGMLTSLIWSYAASMKWPKPTQITQR